MTMQLYDYTELVALATTYDSHTALAADIDADPAVKRIRLFLRASAPPAKAPPWILRPPRPRRPPAPPPLPRCYRSQAYRADSSNDGEASDATSK
jgi:hypothetical protein